VRNNETAEIPDIRAEAENAWSCTFLPQYVFMTWCLVKHRTRVHGVVLSYVLVLSNRLYAYRSATQYRSQERMKDFKLNIKIQNYRSNCPQLLPFTDNGRLSSN
jgi:hypothetical protein